MLYENRIAEIPRESYENIACERCPNMVANFWTASTVWFQGGIGPNSEDSPAPQWLPISDLRKDSTSPFSSTRHLFGNHSQGPQHQTTIFSAILHGALDRANDARKLLQIWLTFYSTWILRKRVWSLDLPHSVVASALIVEPNARDLHDLECLMMFLQNFSAVATS